MNDMLRYSLKELLYWTAVWCVGMAALRALNASFVAVIILTVWFAGTAAINRIFGYVAGLAFAVLITFLFYAFSVAVTAATNSPMPPPFMLWLMLWLVSASSVWLATFSFEKLYTALSRKHVR
jgi:hypothetical protein